MFRPFYPRGKTAYFYMSLFRPHKGVMSQSKFEFRYSSSYAVTLCNYSCLAAVSHLAAVTAFTWLECFSERSNVWPSRFYRPLNGANCLVCSGNELVLHE